jgi:hypothetical protein
VNVVKNESELPLPARKSFFQYFVRSISDPTVLIEGRDGEVYRREDGLRWKYPAYERHCETNTQLEDVWEKLTGRGAWFDDATYPYKEKVAA